MFTRTTAVRKQEPEAKQDTQKALTPYLVGRKEWDDRYGEMQKRAANWRAAAFLALGVAGISSLGSIALYNRAHLVPYVVVADSVGRILAQGPVQETPGGTDAVVKASLNDFVINVRQVVADRSAESHSIDKVYSMLASGTQAERYVSDYFRAESPFERADKGSTSVEIGTILPVSKNTYEVTWAEKSYTHQGELVAGESHHYKGSFSFVVNPPKDEGISRLNPLGIYVSNVSWSQDAIQDSTAEGGKSGQSQ